MKSALLPIIAIAAMSAFFVAGCKDGGSSILPCANNGEETAMADQPDTDMSSNADSQPQNYASVDYSTWKSDSSNAATHMILPTGRMDSSVLLIEKKGPTRVRAGETFTYKIRVTNLTDMALSDVQVTEEIPDNFTVDSIAPQATSKGNNHSWTWDTFGANARKTIEITGHMPKTGMITSCTEATWKYNALCLNVAAVRAALDIQLAGPAQTLVCDPLVYIVTVKNTGDATARNIQLTSNFPERLQSLDGKNNLTHTIDSLDPGASKRLRIRAKADRADVYKHTVSLVADGDISKKSNSVETDVRTPVLVVNVDAPEKRYLDRPIEYNIHLSNTGNAPSTNTILTQNLPSGVEFISASHSGSYKSGTVIWKVGKLDIDEKRSFVVKARASRKGDLEASANATAYCADDTDATGSATTAVAGIPAILLEMIDKADPVEIGNTETYEIRVTNQGSATDSNIVITATLPEEFKFVSSDGPTQGDRDGKTITFRPLDELAPKKQVIYTITGMAKTTGDVRFRVKLETDQTTKPVEETESTHIYE